MKGKTKKEAKPGYSILNNACFLIKGMAEAHPLLIFFIVLEAGLAVLSPILGIYLPKIAIDLVTESADALRVLYILGGFSLLMTLVMALSNMARDGKYMLHNDMRMFYMRELFLKSLDCDYHQIESAGGQTKYQRAFETLDKGDQSGTSKMTVAMIDIFVAVFSFVLYTSIISTLNLFMVILLIALSFINFFAVKNAQEYEHQLRDREAELSKKLRYIEKISSDVKAGKDIRLYGMTGWFLSMRDFLLDAYTALNRKIRMRYFVSGVVNAISLFLRDCIAYGYLTWAVSFDRISIGDFVLYFGAITGFSGFVSRIVNSINEINGANLQMNDLRDFLDNTDAPEPEIPAKLPKTKSLSIEFRDVSFSYDKDSGDVLKHFNMKINEGEKVALVGVNGAGKTTIIKLLCGFYQPDHGEILINDINIKNFRKKDLFTLFSAVFQDVFILPFTAAENISMQLSKDTDTDRALLCLKMAGFNEEILKYPQGINSVMTKSIEDGIILSGGQQQKLLLSRALFKDAPILILDEPTAALDPIAESETYQAFHTLAKDKTSIYISHRLASTRFCDRIIFLHHGIALEVGTHEALLNKGGEYAKMYEMQSHYYHSKGVSGDEI